MDSEIKVLTTFQKLSKLKCLYGNPINTGKVIFVLHEFSYMKPSEIRKKLHKYVDDADNESLQFMSEALALYQAKKGDENKNLEVSYPWAPTDEELIAQIERAEENYKNLS